MKCTNLNTDRETLPLMKELHELGLKHGVIFIALAIPMDEKGPPQTFFIDHRDDTKPDETADAFEAAGVHLIKASEAISDYAREQKSRAAKRKEG